MRHLQMFEADNCPLLPRHLYQFLDSKTQTFAIVARGTGTKLRKTIGDNVGGDMCRQTSKYVCVFCWQKCIDDCFCARQQHFCPNIIDVWNCVGLVGRMPLYEGHKRSGRVTGRRQARANECLQKIVSVDGLPHCMWQGFSARQIVNHLMCIHNQRDAVEDGRQLAKRIV